MEWVRIEVVHTGGPRLASTELSRSSFERSPKLTCFLCQGLFEYEEQCGSDLVPVNKNALYYSTNTIDGYLTRRRILVYWLFRRRQTTAAEGVRFRSLTNSNFWPWYALFKGTSERGMPLPVMQPHNQRPPLP